MFFNLVMMGTLITLSAYSWFSMWIGLEINLLSIIPLFKSNTNNYPAEATLKYFITQALASTMILFTILLSMNMNEFIPMHFNYWMMIILNSALLTKLGAAPFHAWFPEVSEGLNWSNNLLLMTWQKLAPMILIMYNIHMTLFFSLIILFSAIISGIYGLNQTSLRKIMTYSSINHMAWMLASMMNFQMIWLIYFIIYSLMVFNVIIYFWLMNIFYLNQLFLMMNSNKLIKLMFIFNFFSLGGLPPLLGFLPKWLTLNFLINNNFFTLSVILILFTLLTLYFYIRITLSSLTITYNEILIKTSTLNNFIIVILNIITLLSLIICTNLFNFM
uniref:NADH-ubiquinone oxidoreductase chain 2 n=1 Tax=Crepidodera pluta TaxID=715800 RepID=A0A343C2G5_9CUCU|nr:NADH dehydrogenase subunit 2 [Crepidodera pluta]